MRVKDEIYYHCQRQNNLNSNWEIGKIIKFSKDQENFYFLSLKDYLRYLKESISIIDINSNIAKVDDIIHNEDFENKRSEKQTLIKHSQYCVDQITNYFTKTIQLQQEIIFEDVRKGINPQLPSRHNCIWVTKTIRDACKWSEMFDCSKILKLKLNGEIHKTNGKFIDIGQNSDLYTARLNAEKYWEGKYENDNEIEYLFEGQVEIINILE